MYKKIFFTLLLVGVLYASGSNNTQNGMNNSHILMYKMSHNMGMTPLKEAGNDAFGTIQEVILNLLNNPHTDWKNINLEKLRLHLIDMNNFTLHVRVLSQKPIVNGMEVTIKPESNIVDASLQRLFKNHPEQIKKEAGWDMSVVKKANSYIIKVTTTNQKDVDKIRGLGYIGIVAFGRHHQLHHWMLVKGKNPHL